MNNKGFGLPEVLAFIGISMFILVVITIYCNNSNIFNNNNVQDNIEEIKEEDSNEGIVPNKQLIPSEYSKLENEIKNVALNYSFDKTQDTIITSDKLNIKLVDPTDNNINCNGYVIYKSEEKSYTPYINCPGMYVTDNYDFNLE